MKKFFVAISTLAFAITGCAAGGTCAWKCSAANLAGSSYCGGETAYIHLDGYSRGGDYWVKLNQQGSEATGNTADGTPFVCTKGDEKQTK